MCFKLVVVISDSEVVHFLAAGRFSEVGHPREVALTKLSIDLGAVVHKKSNSGLSRVDLINTE